MKCYFCPSTFGIKKLANSSNIGMCNIRNIINTNMNKNKNKKMNTKITKNINTTNVYNTNIYSLYTKNNNLLLRHTSGRRNIITQNNNKSNTLDTNKLESIESIEEQLVNSKSNFEFCTNILPAGEKVTNSNTIETITASNSTKENITKSDTKKIIKDLQELTKLKLSILNTIVSLSTYIFYTNNLISPDILCFTIGTISISMTTQVLNQILEKFFDKNMKRTLNRPLPKERFSRKQASMIAFALYSVHIGMYSMLNFPVYSLILSNAILAMYIGLYTPLKRVNNLSMHVGAIVGALPAVLGAVAAINSIPNEALFLAMYIFGWQYPHFYGILYPNREDYIKAGFKFIAVNSKKDHIAYKQIIMGLGIMVCSVYGLVSTNVIGPICSILFTGSFIYKTLAVLKFTSNPVKYGKIIRIRSYTPLMVVLLCFIYAGIEKRVKKYIENRKGYKLKNCNRI